MCKCTKKHFSLIVPMGNTFKNNNNRNLYFALMNKIFVVSRFPNQRFKIEYAFKLTSSSEHVVNFIIQN